MTIAPSTGQVRSFFDLLGQKQISNAVDASNFTLLGMGHPTHAFDLDKIEGGIVVRLAQRGERLRLLDGTERTLEADDLVIADERKALSLAGVMGGYDSMITPETRNVLVESAWFLPATIRRSSRRYLLHTDASHRFERGADFQAAPLANQLVVDLILRDSAASGGYADGALIDRRDAATERRTAARPPISLSVEQVQRHLGTTLDDASGRSFLTGDLVRRYLTSLGCTLVKDAAETTGSAAGGAHTSGGESFSVTLPSWRLDLEREIDLIEEVARVYGYNRFANTLPAARSVLAHAASASEQAVRTRLLALGFSEALSSTFASAPESDLFRPLAPGQHGEAAPCHAALENPLSEGVSNLRPSLLPGMIAMLSHNLNRDASTARLFEQGHVFTANYGAAKDSASVAEVIHSVMESSSLALGLTIAQPQNTPLFAAHDAPIFELKGAIESLASLFSLPGGAEALRFSTEPTAAWLQPGRSGVALLGKQPLAHFGELSTSESARRKLRQPVYLAEIDVALLYGLPLRKVTAHELSRFQAVERDFSFVFPDAIHWHTIASAISALSLPELQSLAPVEIFRDPKGKSIPAGQHSLLLRTVFQSANRTLTDEELAGFSDRILDALKNLGGTHRA
ncbi:MAG: hypothetical protein NVSMB3_12500 [Acidobacteriaceae bacterium]